MWPCFPSLYSNKWNGPNHQCRMFTAHKAWGISCEYREQSAARWLCSEAAVDWWHHCWLCFGWCWNATKILNYVTRALASCLIGAAIWLAKTLLTLSGPPLMAMAKMVGSLNSAHLSFRGTKRGKGSEIYCQCSPEICSFTVSLGNGQKRHYNSRQSRFSSLYRNKTASCPIKPSWKELKSKGVTSILNALEEGKIWP